MKKDKDNLNTAWFAHWGHDGHCQLNAKNDKMAIQKSKRICCKHLSYVTRCEPCDNEVKTIVIYKSRKLFQ